jgi:beta-lactamase class A
MRELEAFIAKRENRTISVALHDFETGQEILVNADEPYHPASTFKVHVMMEVFHQAEQGLLSLVDCLPLLNSFASIADGSRFSLLESDDAEKTLYARLGENESIRELTRLMIVRSSNLATNILLEKVSVKSVDNFIRAIGIPGVTVLRSIDDVAARRLGMNNSATARGLTQTMNLIVEKKVVSKSASETMSEILLGQEFNESIPALLPGTARVAHKTGWDGDVYHDAGIVYPGNRKPYTLTIMTRGFSEAQAAEAHTCMATISKMIYDQLQ